MKNIVIMGAGELAKEVVWLIEDINRIEPTWVILGFLDDTKEKGTVCYGYPVLGAMHELETLQKRSKFYSVIALQNGRDRARILEEHLDFKYWTSIIHPSAVIAPESSIGTGSIIFPQVTVSVDTNIGKHCLIYLHAVICNDCNIEDYVSLMSGVSLAEHVQVGRESYVSAGCNVYPHISIGAFSRIAVGTTVEEDVCDGTELKKNKGLFFK